MPANARLLTEAQRQLQLLLPQQEQLAIGLYRELALYLQVLREGLQPAVLQACFHLATQVHPDRYAGLSADRRRELQERLRQLSHRCCSLLTVEQLLSLAGQLERRRRRERVVQRQLLETLAVAATGGEASAADPPPEGSISLGLDLPLSADLFLDGRPGLADLPSLAAAATRPLPTAATEGEGKQLFQALFALAAEGLGPSDGERAEGPRPPQPSPQELLRESPQESAAEADQEPVRLVPRDPAALLRWWRRLDQALERRLRNLSHALNVELMRLGLSHSLLPPSLLDAVLAGQVEVQPAPANLLCLPVPPPAAGDAASGAPQPVLAVLLRASDLEFEQPRLRRCRRRLEQRRRELRTMAQRHHGWQQRVQALLAEQQWLQDSAPPPNP